ncbi:UDP-glucose--hexose-1-phosphate uridylyltransferase [Actinomycetaceae bacterium L2_0104]
MSVTSHQAIDELVDYAERTGLIAPEDRVWATNTLLEGLRMDAPESDSLRSAGHGSSESAPSGRELVEILEPLLRDAHERGVLAHDSVVYRDLFDTMLMGRLTPLPREVRAKFWELYDRSPAAATDWYYTFSQDTNYIRRDRMVKDVRWTSDTEYGRLDVTINLSKPEKDPKAIAAARELPAADYPQCLLCRENEGYAGRVNHPARQNHRIVPVTINDAPWYLQYSPYVYYNEHCIVFNELHTPMKIDRACFAKLLDFVRQFPHYFVGSNADLPIVGGSILAHDHFQGGHYEFAMARAGIERRVHFSGFDDVDAGIVTWPMSVLRISSTDRERLIELADRILSAWRGYTDAEAFVFAETDGEPHNTITPIARMRDGKFELDLVLRNNITTREHPLGVYHPHAELHHIKKENIGLIEVMGLAVLPARLKDELAAVATRLSAGTDLRSDPLTEKHADWAEGFAAEVTRDNAEDVIQREVGRVFAKVLEHAGVYGRNEDGQRAFLRFVESV